MKLTGSMTFSDTTCIIANCQDNKGKESTGPFNEETTMIDSITKSSVQGMINN